MIRLVCLPLTILAGAATAQDIPFSAEPIQSCLASTDTIEDRFQCVGVASAACIDTPDGYTTVGMGFCYGREASYWDERLNAAFADLMTVERDMKSEIEAIGGFAPDAPKALRDMQRAWIGFRDATCAYEFTTWGGGTGGGPANAACLMNETGRQALVLEERLSQREQ